MLGALFFRSIMFLPIGLEIKENVLRIISKQRNRLKLLNIENTSFGFLGLKVSKNCFVGRNIIYKRYLINREI